MECTEHGWHMDGVNGTCMAHVWDMYEACMEWMSMHGVDEPCMEHVRSMYGLDEACMEWMNHVWNMYGRPPYSRTT